MVNQEFLAVMRELFVSTGMKVIADLLKSETASFTTEQFRDRFDKELNDAMDRATKRAGNQKGWRFVPVDWNDDPGESIETTLRSADLQEVSPGVWAKKGSVNQDVSFMRAVE